MNEAHTASSALCTFTIHGISYGHDLTAGELVRAVEELRLGAGAEHTRRRELEAALRESAAIFKRELHDKNLELAALQQQLG